MKAHLERHSAYERGRDDGSSAAIAMCLLALHNLYGWGRGPMQRVSAEVLRIAQEAAKDPDWMERMRAYLEQLGVKV